MSWTDVPRESRQVLEKELRCLARDPHTLIYSVFLPLFLYPALTWTILQVAIYLHSVEEAMISRVVVIGAGEDDPLVKELDDKDHPKLKVTWTESGPLPGEGEESVERIAREEILADRTDALLVVPAGSTGADPSVRGRLYYGSARDSSTRARRRVQSALEDLREQKLFEAAEDVLRRDGEPPDDQQVGDFLEVLSRSQEDHSSPQELANYVASMVLPLVMIIMTALGALYPALETTVGEKERATLETTLASPTGRFSLVVGKYLAVVVFALLAFLLNFGSMWFTLFHLRDQFDISGLHLGVEAGVVILVAAVLLALLLSAFMMLLGFLARSFREGQAFVTPVYLLAGIPAIFAASPDVTLTPVLALVPVVNISLLFREALRGDLPGWGTGLTLVSSTLYALLVLVVASRLLRREELALGGGLTVRQTLQSLLGGRPANEEREERQ